MSSLGIKEHNELENSFMSQLLSKPENISKGILISCVLDVQTVLKLMHFKGKVIQHQLKKNLVLFEKGQIVHMSKRRVVGHKMPYLFYFILLSNKKICVHLAAV